MSVLMDRAAFAGHVTRAVLGRCSDPEKGVDGMVAVQLVSGILVEACFVFDEPDLALTHIYEHLALRLGTEPGAGSICAQALPNPTIIDRHTEQGRALARRLFEDWVFTPQDFLDLTSDVFHHLVVGMEEDGQPRAEIFRLLIECSNRCMAYEVAAQELCDIVIDQKIGIEKWSLAESIAGLSAVAGRAMALSFSTEKPGEYKAHDLPVYLDQVAHVMTQEAIRLGIPAGSNWRFGLAANDQPTSAPYELIAALEPACRDFMRKISLNNLVDQAVACAKAAGRMLALASAGDQPEIEPVIAKPLAMAAMSDTYKTVCREFSVG